MDYCGIWGPLKNHRQYIALLLLSSVLVGLTIITAINVMAIMGLLAGTLYENFMSLIMDPLTGSLSNYLKELCSVENLKKYCPYVISFLQTHKNIYLNVILLFLMKKRSNRNANPIATNSASNTRPLTTSQSNKTRSLKEQKQFEIYASRALTVLIVLCLLDLMFGGEIVTWATPFVRWFAFSCCWSIAKSINQYNQESDPEFGPVQSPRNGFIAGLGCIITVIATCVKVLGIL